MKDWWNIDWLTKMINSDENFKNEKFLSTKIDNEDTEPKINKLIIKQDKLFDEPSTLVN